MKKSYTSPNIQFMSIGANSVSAACDLITQNHDPLSCGVDLGPGWDGLKLFADSSVCTYTDHMDVCYHVSAQSSTVFES